MKKNAKQTVADLKLQATSSDDLMRKLAQWDEHGEMSEQTQQEVFGGAVSPNPTGGIIDILLGIWFPQIPTDYAADR